MHTMVRRASYCGSWSSRQAWGQGAAGSELRPRPGAPPPCPGARAYLHLVQSALLLPVLALELPVAAHVRFLRAGVRAMSGGPARRPLPALPRFLGAHLGVPVGHERDVEDLHDQEPGGEEVADKEGAAAGAQRLVVEGHVDERRLRRVGGRPEQALGLGLGAREEARDGAKARPPRKQWAPKACAAPRGGSCPARAAYRRRLMRVRRLPPWRTDRLGSPSSGSPT